MHLELSLRYQGKENSPSEVSLGLSKPWKDEQNCHCKLAMKELSLFLAKLSLKRMLKHIPSQDAPSVKSRYTARVAVPKALKALMSANLASETGESDPQRPEYRTFTFTQDIPIPSYLLAIAVGNLESRSLGPRSKVAWHSCILSVHALPIRSQAVAATNVQGL